MKLSRNGTNKIETKIYEQEPTSFITYYLTIKLYSYKKTNKTRKQELENSEPEE